MWIKVTLQQKDFFLVVECCLVADHVKIVQNEINYDKEIPNFYKHKYCVD